MVSFIMLCSSHTWPVSTGPRFKQMRCSWPTPENSSAWKYSVVVQYQLSWEEVLTQLIQQGNLPHRAPSLMWSLPSETGSPLLYATPSTTIGIVELEAVLELVTWGTSLCGEGEAEPST